MQPAQGQSSSGLLGLALLEEQVCIKSNASPLTHVDSVQHQQSLQSLQSLPLFQAAQKSDILEKMPEKGAPKHVTFVPVPSHPESSMNFEPRSVHHFSRFLIEIFSKNQPPEHKWHTVTYTDSVVHIFQYTHAWADENGLHGAGLRHKHRRHPPLQDSINDGVSCPVKMEHNWSV